jgi:hypothetical protein
VQGDGNRIAARELYYLLLRSAQATGASIAAAARVIKPSTPLHWRFRDRARPIGVFV